jgi:hypothetical protein
MQSTVRVKTTTFPYPQHLDAEITVLFATLVQKYHSLTLYVMFLTKQRVLFFKTFEITSINTMP